MSELRSRAEFPASSNISAIKYSNAAVKYIAVPLSIFLHVFRRNSDTESILSLSLLSASSGPFAYIIVTDFVPSDTAYFPSSDGSVILTPACIARASHNLELGVNPFDVMS